MARIQGYLVVLILKLVRGDGDGWVVSDDDTYHWGVYGAAGLLLRAPWRDGTPAVLLQHRALWSHHGGTWGLPGGALDSHETAEQAAVREAYEEAGLRAEHVQVRATLTTAEVYGPDGAHWRYTTVVADAAELLPTQPNRESTELRWVPEREVADLPLHSGFAASWETLRAVPSVPEHDCGRRLPHTVVVTENVFAWCTPVLTARTPAPR